MATLCWFSMEGLASTTDRSARLGDVTQPVLVLAGRHDRTCPVEASEEIAEGVRQGELVVFESSGHMTYVEENDAYISTVRDFLERRRN